MSLFIGSVASLHALLHFSSSDGCKKLDPNRAQARTLSLLAAGLFVFYNSFLSVSFQPPQLVCCRLITISPGEGWSRYLTAWPVHGLPATPSFNDVHNDVCHV